MNKKHYIILIGLVILFGLTSLLSNVYKFGWLDSFSSNLSSGFLGAFLTAWLIERSLANERKLEIERVNNIAFNQLRPMLLRHLGVLIDWYKAASPKKPNTFPESIDEIFNEDYFAQVLFLDFSKDSQSLSQMDWFTYTMIEFENMQKQIAQVIDKYASFLNVDAIELLERLSDSELMKMLIAIGHSNLLEIDKRYGWKRTYNILNTQDAKNTPSLMVEEHIKNLLTLLDFYNSVAQRPIQVVDLGLWRENSSPEFGSGRLDTN